jgi:hypothetical protein
MLIQKVDVTRHVYFLDNVYPKSLQPLMTTREHQHNQSLKIRITKFLLISYKVLFSYPLNFTNHIMSFTAISYAV